MSNRAGWFAIIGAVAACGCGEPSPPSGDRQEPQALSERDGAAANGPSEGSMVLGSDGEAYPLWSWRPLSSSGEALRDARREAGSRVTGSPPPDDPPLEVSLEALGDQLVDLTLTFPDDDLPSIAEVARLPSAERAALVAEREEASFEGLHTVLSEARSLGARSTSVLWLTHSLQATVPASRAAVLVTRHPTATASINGRLAMEWDGGRVRSQTGGSRLVTAGYDGDPPGTPRYRMAIIEAQNDGPNWPVRTHPAFRESGTDSTSRISIVENCNACIQEFLGICFEWGCRPVSPSGSGIDHGTIVTWVAAGSIEQGQDPGIPDPGQRRRRSGVAPEPIIDYFGVNDCDAVSRALQRAVARGVDVVNMSFRGDFVLADTSSCDASMNCGGINEAIRAATDAGILVVKAAGNLGNRDPDCSITYPAWRPEVISVGGLDTHDPFSNLASVSVDSSSSRGGVAIRYAAMTTDTMMSGVGLAAPDAVECFPDVGGGFGWSCGFSASGTSFAAPVVSGLATLFAHSLSNGGSIANARDLLVNVLLMGDRGASSGLTTTEGFGRARAFAPTPAVLTAPWGWGTHRIHGGVGTTTVTVWDAGPESPYVREWRWATASFENNLRSLQTDYVIRVVDACPPGGGRHLVASDYSFDPRKRIELSHAQICPPGRANCRCLEMEVEVLQAPPSGVTIHMADYFHGGDENVF